MTEQQIAALWDQHFHSRSSYYWLDFAEALLEAVDGSLTDDELIELWANHCNKRLSSVPFSIAKDKNKGVEFGHDILDKISNKSCNHVQMNAS